jgi:adenosylcobinamide-phosphate synthase
VSLDAQDDVRTRKLLSSLVSRDVQTLDRAQAASAAIESAAENVTDAFLAPWLFYALGGLPAALAYRALNTLDSMWGYRTPEYEHLGKAAARLDDAANYLPATLAPRFMLAAGDMLGHDTRAGREMLARDGAHTTSPNAGRAMSAMAGLLGVRLEKPGTYALGDSRRVADTTAIRKAERIVWATAGLGLGISMALAWLRGGEPK